MKLLLASFAAALPLIAPARADVTVLEDKIEWYDVQGASPADLRKSLDANSPLKGFDAESRWWVDWRYQWRAAGDGCALTNVVVMLRVETSFPRLASEDGMPPDVLEKWWNFTAALMAHERAHARHGAQAAEEIDRTLKSFTIPNGCNAIQDQANAAAEKIIKKANKADEDYDNLTDHGVKEGVVLQ